MDDFTTSRGKVVKFLPIAFLLDKFRQAHKLPDPPIYEVETATGIKEKHPHDPTTLQTDDDRAAWAKYQADLIEAEAKSSRDLMRLVFMRGIDFEMPTDDAWVKEQVFLGNNVPTDPIERRMFYIETEVMGSLEDYQQVLMGTLIKSGVNEEAVSEVEKFFRRKVSGNADTPVSSESGQVDNEPAVQPNPNGDALGHDAEPVRRAKRRG